MGRLHALIAGLAAAAALAACASDGGEPPPEPDPDHALSVRIRSVSPRTVEVGHYASVLTLSGTGFTAGSTVTIEGVARQTTFASPARLTARLLASDVATARQLRIAVATPGSAPSAARLLAVKAPVPTILAVSPNPVYTPSGPATITVTGTGFTADARVTWNGEERSTVHRSVTELQAQLQEADLDPGVAGSVAVVNPAPVGLGGGRSATVRVPVAPRSPIVSTVAPTSIAPGSPGFVLTIQGRRFTRETKVLWNGSARPTTLLSPSFLQAAIDPADVATSGSAELWVYTPGGGGELAGRFTIAAPGGKGPQAVAYQLDPAHSGHVEPGAPLSFPADPAWIATLADVTSYPLVADGKAFVLVRGADDAGGAGVRLVALDLATGATAWGPIALAAPTSWGAHAYDRGRLFVVTGGGVLREFDAASGAAGWGLTRSEPVLGPPTAVEGTVYVTAGGTLMALAAESGTLRWSAPVAGADASSPAVGPDGVFAASRCQAYKLDARSGGMLWLHDDACVERPGRTAAYGPFGVYVRGLDGPGAPCGTVLDRGSGARAGTFGPAGGDPVPIPALAWGTTYLVAGGALEARDVAGGLRFRFAPGGALTSAPLVIGGAVIVGSATGTVYALDATTGAPLWTGDAGAPISAPDELAVTQPLTGLAAGEGYLVVPAGRRVTAWRVVP